MVDMPNAGNGNNDMMRPTSSGGKSGDPRLIGVRRYPPQQQTPQGAVNNGSENSAGTADSAGDDGYNHQGHSGGEQIQRMRMSGQNGEHDRGVRIPPMRPASVVRPVIPMPNNAGNPVIGSAGMRAAAGGNHAGIVNNGARSGDSDSISERGSENPVMGAVRHGQQPVGNAGNNASHAVGEHRGVAGDGSNHAVGVRPGAGIPQRTGHAGLRPAVGEDNGIRDSAVNSGSSRFDGEHGGLDNAVSSRIHDSGERAVFNQFNSSGEHASGGNQAGNQTGGFNEHAGTHAGIGVDNDSSGLPVGVHHPVLRPRFAETSESGTISGQRASASAGASHVGSARTNSHAGNVGSHVGSGGVGSKTGSGNNAGSKTSRDGFSSKADDEGRYRYGDDGRRLNGPGTGRRAGDKARRDYRASVNAVLSDEQARLVNRLNKQLLKRDSRAKAFQMTKRDQQVFDYLVRFRFATIRDVSRVAGWSESYMKTNRRFNSYLDLGLVRADRVPLENFRYVQATPLGVRLSSYYFLGSENDSDVLRSNRGHQFGLSSLASHLMNHRGDADETEHDLLGLGDDEWLKLRHEILSGVSHVVSEREYRSSWTKIRVSATGRSPSSLTDAKYRHAMENLYKKAHENPDDMSSELKGDTFEFFSTNPEYMGENAWLWVIYGNDVIQKDGHGGIRRLSVDSGMVSLDDKGRPVINSQRGDLFSTQDHCPDLVIARPRDRKTGRPNSIAVELEITGKDIDDYFQTMCGYTSRCGRLLYKMVVWQVVNAAVGNKIRAGAVKAGAVEGRDFIITTVYSKDMKSSYNRGADMLPGKWADDDKPYGYTVERTSDEEAGYADLAGLLNE